MERVIIEQKIADLELALTRQEQLIRSQRDVLNGLKDLIVSQLLTNNNNQQVQAHQSYLQQGIALSSNLGGTNAFLASMSSTTNTHQDEQPTNTSTVAKKLLTKQPQPPLDESLEPTKKKVKVSNDEQKNVPSSSGTSVTPAAKSTSSSPVPHTSPAAPVAHPPHHNSHQPPLNHSMNHGYPITFTAPFVITKRKRALEKVSQFVSQIPDFLIFCKSPPSRPSLSTHTSRTSTPQPQAVVAPVEVEEVASEVVKAVLSTSAPLPAPAQHAPASHVAVHKPSAMIVSDKVHVVKNSAKPVAAAAEPPHALAATQPLPSHSVNAFDVQYLEGVTTTEQQLVVTQEWLAKSHLQPKECKQLLDQERVKAVFGRWLRSIDTDAAPTKDTALLIDHLLKLLALITFSDSEVASSRLDKALRRIYKKWNGHKEIFSPDLLSFIRSSWSRFRATFRAIKKESGGGNDDDEDD